MAAALAIYVGIEVASYRSAYPDGVSPLQFEMFADNPAVRMLNGVPHALDTAAGFAVWDAGWIFELLVAVWAILTTTRFLRAEEDSERSEIVLATPLRATQLTAVILLIVASAGLVIGAVVTVTMVATGNPLGGSVLLGLALAGVGATFAATAGLASQLVEVRRRAAGLAALALGAAYVLRMVGTSADSRLWVRWTTPLGWLDELKPYGERNLLALLPLLLVPIVLSVVTVWLRGRRDTGRALLVTEGTRAPHLGRLGSPVAFAWRSNRGVLAAWVISLAAYSAIFGSLVSTMIDWLSTDEGYQRILAEIGLDQALTISGFVAMIGVFLGVAVVLQVVWRMGAARAEEESGRVEAVLARKVTRLRWLGGHVILSAAGGVLLLLVIGASMWAGASLTGSQDIAFADTMRAALNVLPVVVLTVGLTVLTFGLIPRLTVALPLTVTVVGFVLSLLGPALSWPTWVLNMSPFTHLAFVPAEPWAAGSGVVMTALGIALAAAGIFAFRRRDIVGG